MIIMKVCFNLVMIMRLQNLNQPSQIKFQALAIWI